MSKLTKILQNQKGSTILQSIIVAGMIATLSASLSTLNLGRGRANIQALKKASAINLSQILTMHLANENLCTASVVVGGAVSPANHTANNGIDMQVRFNYPTWADGANGVKLVPTGVIANDQIGDSSLYFNRIRFQIPMLNANTFDPAVLSTYALPDGVGGFRPIAKYQGQLLVELADNSELPIPLAPIRIPFIVNLDMTNPAAPVFESCSADRGVTEYCEQLGCNWETVEAITNPDGSVTRRPLDPLDPDPLRWPKCVCGPADVPACGPDANGRPQYIADFNPNTMQPICRGWFIDCSDPANAPPAVRNDPTLCFGNPLTCPGWFVSGFLADGSVTCEPGGTRITSITDCADQLVTWVENTNICQAPSGGVIPDQARRDLTDSTGFVTGTASFTCNAGLLTPVTGTLLCSNGTPPPPPITPPITPSACGWQNTSNSFGPAGSGCLSYDTQYLDTPRSNLSCMSVEQDGRSGVRSWGACNGVDGDAQYSCICPAGPSLAATCQWESIEREYIVGNIIVPPPTGGTFTTPNNGPDQICTNLDAGNQATYSELASRGTTNGHDVITWECRCY